MVWEKKEKMLDRIKRYKAEGSRHSITLRDKEGIINGKIITIGKDFIEMSDGSCLVTFPLWAIESISCYFSEAASLYRPPNPPQKLGGETLWPKN